MRTNKIPLVHRDCDLCQSNKLEPIWSYDHITKTRNQKWLFQVRNVICENCGFVFTSPVFDQKSLLGYYRDSFSKFSNQKLDYDVRNRLEVIDRFHNQEGGTYIEVGANLKTEFHKEVNKRFARLLTVEPNDSTQDDYTEIKEIKSKATCIAHYFVLEHVADIKGFLNMCYNLLDEDGIMICEVPSLRMYNDYISPLILFEHVNHFTPETLKCIAASIGFEEVFTSNESCSRPFGFVSVFKKGSVQKLFLNVYNENRESFFNGMAKKLNFDKEILKVKTLLSENSSTIIIWAANESTQRLLENLTIGNKVTIIDSDPRKKDYFNNLHEVKTPEEAKDQIRDARFIIICTELHSEDILAHLKINYNKEFLDENIFIADKL